MTTPRSLATRLPDGRVILTGAITGEDAEDVAREHRHRVRQHLIQTGLSRLHGPRVRRPGTFKGRAA